MSDILNCDDSWPLTTLLKKEDNNYVLNDDEGDERTFTFVIENGILTKIVVSV